MSHFSKIYFQNLKVILLQSCNQDPSKHLRRRAIVAKFFILDVHGGLSCTCLLTVNLKLNLSHFCDLKGKKKTYKIICQHAWQIFSSFISFLCFSWLNLYWYKPETQVYWIICNHNSKGFQFCLIRCRSDKKSYLKI